MRPLALLLALAACKGGPEGSTPAPSPAPVDPYGDCDLLWERDIVGFFDNWCAPCHSAAIPPEWRQGAPEGVDLDSLDNVRLWAERVRVTALGEAPSMPPAGGTAQAERDLVTAWLDCGMPGEEVVEVDPCEGVPTVSLAATDDPAALCAGDGRLTVEGDLVVDAPLSLDCACAVTGDVWLAAPLEAPALRTIGGGLRVTGTASLEGTEWIDVGGDLEVTDLQVDNLYLDRIATVGGAVSVHDTDGLARLSLAWLRSAGGPTTVTDAPGLIQLAWPRLASVGGDLLFEGLPVLASMEATVAVAHLEGQLVIRDTGVVRLDDLRGYERIDGGVVIEANPALLSLDGFWHLEQVSTVSVRDNPLLQSVTGFDVLPALDTLELQGNPSLATLELPATTTLGTLGVDDAGLWITDAPLLTTVDLPLLEVLGGLRLVRTGVIDLSAFEGVDTLGSLALVDNDALVTVESPSRTVQLGSLQLQGNAVLEVVGLPAVAHAYGTVEVRDQPQLTTLDLGGLATVEGDVVLDALPALVDVQGLGGLVTVDGGLQLTALDRLEALGPLHGLEAVGADLVVRDNPVLPDAEVQALIEAIDAVGGVVDVGGNGP